jgi:hypothetical protein
VNKPRCYTTEFKSQSNCKFINVSEKNVMKVYGEVMAKLLAFQTLALELVLHSGYSIPRERALCTQ